MAPCNHPIARELAALRETIEEASHRHVDMQSRALDAYRVAAAHSKRVTLMSLPILILLSVILVWYVLAR